jgi:hypothetical protein
LNQSEQRALSKRKYRLDNQPVIALLLCILIIYSTFFMDNNRTTDELSQDNNVVQFSEDLQNDQADDQTRAQSDPDIDDNTSGFVDSTDWTKLTEKFATDDEFQN